MSRVRPKCWDKISYLVVLLQRTLYSHPLAGLLLERQLEESASREKMGQSTGMGASLRAE